MSFFFKSIEGSTRIAPLVIVLTMLAFGVPLVLDFKPLTYLLFIVFPSPCFMAVNTNLIEQKVDGFTLKISMSEGEGLTILGISTLFYLFLAIFLDSLMNSRVTEPIKKDARKLATKVIDEQSLLTEALLANDHENNESYITTNQVSKIYEAGKSKKKKESIYCVKEITFNLKQNEILGVIGPNGAGKSTLVNLLTNFCARSDGQISLNSEDLKKKSIKKFFRNASICLQEDVVWEELSIQGHFELIAGLRGVNLSVIQTWLESLSLEKFKSYRA